MNLGELRTRVKQLIFKPNTTATDDSGRPTNAEIDAFINESRNSMYNDVLTNLSRRKLATTTFTYTGGAISVTLPTALQGVMFGTVWASYGSNGTDQAFLEAITSDEWVNFSEFGSADCYTVMGNDFFMRPSPNENVTIHVLARPNLTYLSSLTDIPSEFPDWSHPLIAYKAALKIRMVNGDPADGLGQMWQEDYDNLVKWFERQMPDNHVHQTARVDYPF